MLHIPLLKLASSATLLLLAIFLSLSWKPHPLPPLVTTTINFESISSNGEIVRNQFASNGIVFQPILGVDYEQGIPIPNFTHSGAKAVELCFAQEFCTSRLDMSFTAPQRRVKLWTGFTGRIDTQEIVIVRAFDENGNEVTVGITSLGPSTGPIPISKPIEVSAPTATIVRVTAGFIRAEPSIGTMFNNGLAFDDIEFDDQGPAPQCPATQPPTFTVNEPTNGQIVVQNAFTLDANLFTNDPFATLQITATGSAGPKTFGPVFAASGHLQIFNISGLLSPGQNTIVFTAKDCAGTTQVTRTVTLRQITHTAIRVINEANQRVQTARVYANGFFIGLTDANGELKVTPALASGTKLVARKLVAESSTGRANHAQGSNQNWKFRVYISSQTVNNSGSLSFKPVNYIPDPDAPQVLQVMRRNALIGIHLVASMEWDASASEMEIVKQKLLDTSKIFYNLTDGQMFIEQAEVVDDSKFWSDADIRVLANQSLRAFVDDPVGAFFGGSSWIHVRPSSPPTVYAHEFGHYGWGSRDEYKDDDATVQCTALLSDDTATNPFKIGAPKASCIMFDAGQVKMCSGRPENPHKKGTRQGDSSCWTTFANRFKDSNSTARWILRTPDTRGSIPGPINGNDLPLNDMITKVSVQNGSRPNLCLPIMILAKHSDGTPHEGREIRLKTTYNANILEGKTNAQGNLTVTGSHVGDKIEGTVVQFVNCTTTARVAPDKNVNDSFVAAGYSQDVQEGRQTLDVGPLPLKIMTTLQPTKDGAQVTVKVGDSSGKTVALTRPPVIKLRLKGEAERALQARYEARAAGYSMFISSLPNDSEFDIEVTATDAKGQVVQSTSTFRIDGIDSGVETDIMSADGQLRLTVGAKGLPAGSRVAIGPAIGMPAAPDGSIFVSGPFSVAAYPTTKLTYPGRITFQLPQERGSDAFAKYEKDSIKLVYYDGSKWVELKSVVHPTPIEIVSAETTSLGVFALVGKPLRYYKPAAVAELFSTAIETRFDVLEEIFR